ncbi:hypothetical protein [Pseudoroseicyclus sp. CXY001]|uniref:hypothetical protein n=1 Tax=Pseudoroseicyclus sp. CXY001 TaxID=3242492 RepID=UPI003570E797
MTDYLPEAVRKGLEEAHRNMLRKSKRLCVHDGEDVHRVLRLWESGFALESDAPPLRGFVDIYDGPRHLYSCLVVSSEVEGDEHVYEFKRATPVSDRPALDFEQADEFVPAGLLTRE